MFEVFIILDCSDRIRFDLKLLVIMYDSDSFADKKEARRRQSDCACKNDSQNNWMTVCVCVCVCV